MEFSSVIFSFFLVIYNGKLYIKIFHAFFASGDIEWTLAVLYIVWLYIYRVNRT